MFSAFLFRCVCLRFARSLQTKQILKVGNLNISACFFVVVAKTDMKFLETLSEIFFEDQQHITHIAL